MRYLDEITAAYDGQHVTGAWRVSFFTTKKAAQAFADDRAIRNCPIVKTSLGWRLCWLPEGTRYS